MKYDLDTSLYVTYFYENETENDLRYPNGNLVKLIEEHPDYIFQVHDSVLSRKTTLTTPEQKLVLLNHEKKQEKLYEIIKRINKEIRPAEREWNKNVNELREELGL